MKKELSKQNIPWFFCIPLIVMAGIVPLVVRLHFVPVDPAVESIWLNETTTADFCSYNKSLLIMVLGLLCVLILAYCILKGKIQLKERFVLISLGCFALMIVISTIFSKESWTALFGFPQRYEGMLVLLAYIAAFLLSFYLSVNQKAVKYVLGALFISVLVISSIGILQYFGINLFLSGVGKFLIIPMKYANIAKDLAFNFGKGYACSTVYSSNTLGNYMSMVLPLLIAFLIASENWKQRIFYGLSCAAAFACLLISQSRGGYLGAVIALVVLVVLARKRFLARWKVVITVFAALLTVFVFVNIYTAGSISNRIISMTKFKGPVNQSLNFDGLQNFKIEGSNLSLFTKNAVLRVSVSDKGLSFCDGDGKDLAIKALEGGIKYEIADDRYAGYLIKAGNNYISFEKINALNFCIQNGSFQFVDTKGRIVKPIKVETLGFSGMEGFASNRGYIWSRSIPLLKNTLILGHGPDTYAVYFPQYDYMGKLRFMLDANTIVDKPHNMLLQMGINTGVVSLLAFLTLILFYTKYCVKYSASAKFDNKDDLLAAGLFVAVIGYLVSGMFTDSTVSVSPVFWVIFGLGFGTVVHRDREKS